MQHDLKFINFKLAEPLTSTAIKCNILMNVVALFIQISHWVEEINVQHVSIPFIKYISIKAIFIKSNVLKGCVQ